jgi:hypothetical protein
MIERWSASGLNARYAKTAKGIVSRLSTSTAPRYEVCRCRATRTD